MSDHGTERRPGEQAEPGHGAVRSEDDRVPSIRILAVGIGALVIFFLASFVTLSYLRVREGERPLLPVPPGAPARGRTPCAVSSMARSMGIRTTPALRSTQP